MALRTRTVLKSYFETGDKPTQAQFGDFIDSVPNISDDGVFVEHFKGTYADETALTTAHPTASDGDYAYISTIGADAIIWLWDEDDSAWVEGGTAGALTPDATTTIKGKSELIEDAELDSATPSDNSATTPTESAITLGIRQLYRLWKKFFTVFYTKTEADGRYDKIEYHVELSADQLIDTVVGNILFKNTSGGVVNLTCSGITINGSGSNFPIPAGKYCYLRRNPTDSTKYIATLADTTLSGGGSGDVVGPASATDNSLARFDTTTGKLIQNSNAILDDSGNLTTTDVTVSSVTASTPSFFDGTKKLISATGALLGTFWHTLTAKSTPVDADEIMVLDSDTSFEAKKTTLTQFWTNYLKPKNDAQYWIQGGNTLSADTILGTSGAFAIDLRTNNFTCVKLLASPASSVNYLTVLAATNTTPIITIGADGTTTAVGILIQPKSGESIYMRNTGGGGSLKLKWYDSNGSVYRDVISEVGTSNAVGIATGFTTVNTAPNFNLGNNAVFRAANNILKIVGSSSTTSSFGVVFGTNSANFGTFAPTAGTHYLINMWSETNNSFNPTSGNANFRVIDMSAFTINQTVAASGNVSMINVNPTVTSVTGSLYAIRSNIASGSNLYNLFIDGTANNYLNGNTSIKTTTATAFLTLGGSTTSNASLRILAGSAPISPNDGDIWYDGTNIFLRVGGTTKTFTII